MPLAIFHHVLNIDTALPQGFDHLVGFIFVHPGIKPTVLPSGESRKTDRSGLPKKSRNSSCFGDSIAIECDNTMDNRSMLQMFFAYELC